MKIFKIASAVVVGALALGSVGGALVFSQAYAQAPAVTATVVTAPAGHARGTGRPGRPSRTGDAHGR